MEEKLIEAVKCHRILYDKTHAQYRRVDKKDKIWKEISKSIDIEESKCRLRWKSLRDQFIRELRMSKQPSGSATIDRKKWKYFELLLFLKDSSLPRGSSCNLEFEDSVTSELEDVFDMDRSPPPTSLQFLTDKDAMSLEEDVAILNFGNNSNPSSSQSMFESRRSATPQASTSKSEYRRGTSTPSSSKGTIKPDNFKDFLKDLLEEVRRPEEDNSLDSFFKSLSILIKSMELSPLEVLELQSKIMNFVQNELQKYKK